MTETKISNVIYDYYSVIILIMIGFDADDHGAGGGL